MGLRASSQYLQDLWAVGEWLPHSSWYEWKGFGRLWVGIALDSIVLAMYGGSYMRCDPDRTPKVFTELRTVRIEVERESYVAFICYASLFGLVEITPY